MIIRITGFIVGIRDNEDVDDFLAQLDELLDTWDKKQTLDSWYDFRVDEE